MADGYTVTGAFQTQQLGPTGNLVDVMEVTYQLDNGAGSGTVTVPLDANWYTNAVAAVQQQATQQLKLLGL